MSRTRVIAVVDDDEAMREALRELIEVCALECRTFSGAEDFLASWRPGDYGCVVTDLRMPGWDGLALMRRLRTLDPAVPVVIVTSSMAEADRRAAVGEGAFAYLVKPLNGDVLIGHLRAALAQSGPTPKGS